MSKDLYNTSIEHTSDATFRTWGSALKASIATVIAAGGFLAQTADTGQINWASVTRPATNTAAGYEVYAFADALAGSAPIVFKLEYGTGSAATGAQMWITVGTGSNGSGTITGVMVARRTFLVGSAPGSAVNLFPTYVSSVAGFFGIGFKLGYSVVALGSGAGLLGIGRPCNQDGSLRSDAVTVYTHPTGAPTVVTARFADGVNFSTTTGFCLRTYGITNSSVGAAFQAWRHVCAYPQTYGFSFFGTVLQSEFPANTSDTATFYGATPRTYVSLGNPINGFSAIPANLDCPYMIWET